MEAAIRQEPFRRIPLRRARELGELPSAFPTCKIGDRTATESKRLIKRMGFVDIQCCIVCVEKRQCGGGGTAVKNGARSEEEDTRSRARGDPDKYGNGRLSI